MYKRLTDFNNFFGSQPLEAEALPVENENDVEENEECQDEE